jgi:hypothetical protein
MRNQVGGVVGLLTRYCHVGGRLLNLGLQTVPIAEGAQINNTQPHISYMNVRQCVTWGSI